MPARADAASSREAPSTREQILDAAERRFAAHGFAGVSTREIATDAGLKNQASLYHHFRDKQALYEAVLARGIEPIVTLIAQSAMESAPAGAVDGVLDALLDYLEARPHVPQLIQRAGLDDARHLRTTVARLLRPLYTAGLRTLAGAPWAPADRPHVAAGMYHLIFGWFANAPLLAVVFDDSPTSAAALARQRRFLKAAIAQLLGRTPVRRLPSRARRPR